MSILRLTMIFLNKRLAKQIYLHTVMRSIIFLQIKCGFIGVFLLLVSPLIGQLAYSLHPMIFYSDDGGYLEIYSGIQGKTLTKKGDKSMFEYILQIDNDQSKSIFLDKYAIELNAEQMDTDFWDIQRIGLEDGNYDMTMYLIDTYSSDTTKYAVTLEVKTPTSAFLSKPVICTSIGSQPELPFEKFGFRYEKLAYNLVTEEQNKLCYFQEYYQPTIDANAQYLVKYSVLEGFRNPSMPGEALMKGFEKLDGSKQGVYTKTFDISDLGSGDYHLLTEYIDSEQNVLTTDFQNFQVMRPRKEMEAQMKSDTQFEQSWVQLLNKEETIYALKAIAPQVGGQQSEILNSVLFAEDLTRMRYFVYAYWAGAAPGYAEEAYNSYMKVAEAVDKTYVNNVGYGFETDRGFYFLKYGKPDILISEEHEPSAPPYEIWIYNKLELTGETDVRFLFYNPTLSKNDFEVLHSTSNFDVRNPDWQRSLYNKAQGEVNGDFNAGEVGDNYQRNAVNYFNNF